MSLNKGLTGLHSRIVLRQLLSRNKRIPCAYFCSLKRKEYDVMASSQAMRQNHVRYLSTLEFIRNKVTSFEGPKSEDGQRQGGRSGRWGVSTEWKIISSFALGVFSWLMTSYFDRQHARKEVQLELINRQIRDLYGPLYGNRLVQETTYRAVVGEHAGLQNYLKKAEEAKDADMIRRWRSFVWNVMYPMDKQAEQLICKNAHLIVNSEFPEEFEQFLTYLAQLQFVMEHWKNENGKLESVEEFTPDDFMIRNNAPGERGLKEMLSHVEQKYKELRAKQKQLIVETSADDQSVTSLLSKAFK
ncbi:uncharacterized protein LOC100184681 [Ciona intestinalis]